MKKIYQTRRVHFKEKRTYLDYRTKKNPHYNPELARLFSQQGRYYTVLEYIEEEVEKTEYIKKSHIEYKIKCDHCRSLQWVRRKDARFCTEACRKLNHNMVL